MREIHSLLNFHSIPGEKKYVVFLLILNYTRWCTTQNHATCKLLKQWAVPMRLTKEDFMSYSVLFIFLLLPPYHQKRSLPTVLEAKESRLSFSSYLYEQVKKFKLRNLNTRGELFYPTY